MKIHYLESKTAGKVAEFAPNGDAVTVTTMFRSITGCFSPYVHDSRVTLTIEAARVEYARLVKVGYSKR